MTEDKYIKINNDVVAFINNSKTIEYLKRKDIASKGMASSILFLIGALVLVAIILFLGKNQNFEWSFTNLKSVFPPVRFNIRYIIFDLFQFVFYVLLLIAGSLLWFYYFAIIALLFFSVLSLLLNPIFGLLQKLIKDNLGTIIHNTNFFFKNIIQLLLYGKNTIEFIYEEKDSIISHCLNYINSTKDYLNQCSLLDQSIIDDIKLTKITLETVSNIYSDEISNEIKSLNYSLITNKEKVIVPSNQEGTTESESFGENTQPIRSDIAPPPRKSPSENFKTQTRKPKSSELSKEHIGIVGERIVLWYETELVKSYYPAQLNKVQHVSQTQGDGLGYDIQSVDEYGQLKFIEVKSTTSSDSTNFFFTKNEYDTMMEKDAQYYLYRVYNINPETNGFDLKIYKGKDEILKAFNFEGQQYTARAK